MNYPTLVGALREFDLITDEQAERAVAEYDRAVDDWNWWFALSKIAWDNQPLRKRAFRHSLAWRFDWMRSNQ